MDMRQQSLQNWVSDSLPALSLCAPEGILETVSGDASFRRYFRQRLTNGETLIAVDAPPDKEDSTSFVQIAMSWSAQGINVPKVIKADLSQGFMLLSDFGDQLILPLLTMDSADSLYGKAISALVDIQQTQHKLPPYDAALLDREMALFRDWYLLQHLKLTLTRSDELLLKETFELLRETALGQPQIAVHRDYHSRNLMLTKQDDLGIIDFQDAVMGPLTYDLVSLLRDCYIQWPKDKVQEWAMDYFRLAHSKGLDCGMAQTQLMLWFDWMGMQRHLKAVGIFARLNYRDGKGDYLNDIPRTLNYLIEVSADYDALAQFNQWLQVKVLPVQETLSHYQGG